MRRRAISLIAASLVALVPASASAQDHVIDASAEPSFLYVVSGASGSVDGEAVILDAVPNVVYFSDRPARIAGHMTIDELARLWSDESSFAIEPPNAVLSVLGPDQPSDVVVEVVDTQATDQSVRFTVVVLDGELPDGTFGPASIFIDVNNGMIR